MIYVIHGEDLSSSYARLQQILKNYPDHIKVRFDERNSKEELFTAILTKDLLGVPKVIICENFISSKKIKIDDLESKEEGQILIVWEKIQLSFNLLSKIKKTIRVELFKPRPKLYAFLDSLSPNPVNTLKHLNTLRVDSQQALTWHLASRIQLLILAKLNFTKEESEKITSKALKNWQWQKILSQARPLNLSALKKLFAATIKIDYLIKSGKTSLDETHLISASVSKYLSS